MFLLIKEAIFPIITFGSSLKTFLDPPMLSKKHQKKSLKGLVLGHTCQISRNKIQKIILIFTPFLLPLNPPMIFDLVLLHYICNSPIQYLSIVFEGHSDPSSKPRKFSVFGPPRPQKFENFGFWGVQHVVHVETNRLVFVPFKSAQ